MLYTSDRRIHKDLQHRLIFDLVGQVRSGTINMNPSYQRGLVWTVDQKQNLIDTITWGVSVPSIYLRLLSLGSKVPYEVVDGKQRLNALREFMDDEFEFRGVRYSQLSDLEQRRFQSETIGVVVVSRLSDEEVEVLYNRVNFCGVPHEGVARVNSPSNHH